MRTRNKCKFCGCPFWTEYARQRFCSDACEKDFTQYKKDHQTPFGRKINGWMISGFNDTLKQQVLERDGRKCYICGKEYGLHVHHIKPRDEGGEHSLDNLVTLCSGCHMSVESGNIEKAISKCVRRAVKNCYRVFNGSFY